MPGSIDDRRRWSGFLAELRERLSRIKNFLITNECQIDRASLERQRNNVRNRIEQRLESRNLLLQN